MVRGSSSQRRPLDRGSRLDFPQSHHPEGIEELDQASNDRNQQCHLQGAVGCVRADAEDFILNRFWLFGEELFEFRIC